jgi:hypothetical protein
MTKQIKFEHKGKEFCLEYTRETVRQMEREGFKSSDILEKPMLTLPKLFSGAFKAHHRFGTKANEIEEMFDLFTNKDALFEKLVEMYNEPMEAMLDEPKDEGNAIAWDASF